MALSATASQGFEFDRYIAPNEVMWVPGDPGDTVTRGDMLSITSSEGVLDGHAAAEVPIGVALETVVVTAAGTAGFPKFGPNPAQGWGQVQDDTTKTLIPILPFVPCGTPVFKCSIASQTDDENITSWTASTYALVTTAVAADDDSNGALLYIYGGPGAGQWNVVADCTATSNTLTLHRTFNTAPTAASDIIYLPGAAADNAAIGFFSRVTATDANTINAADGSTDGEFRVWLDGRDVQKYLHQLMLPVIPSAVTYFA